MGQYMRFCHMNFSSNIDSPKLSLLAYISLDVDDDPKQNVEL